MNSKEITLSDIIRILQEKANLDQVFQKQEIIDLLKTKIDSSDVYDRKYMTNALSLKACKDETYSKVDADKKFATKAEIMTAKDIQQKLDQKADISSYITTTAVNALLDKKANLTDIVTKKEFDKVIGSLKPGGSVPPTTVPPTTAPGIANTTTAGLIKAGSQDGELTVAQDGLAKVNGYDSMLRKIQKNIQDIALKADSTTVTQETDALKAGKLDKENNNSVDVIVSKDQERKFNVTFKQPMAGHRNTSSFALSSQQNTDPIQEFFKVSLKDTANPGTFIKVDSDKLNFENATTISNIADSVLTTANNSNAANVAMLIKEKTALKKAIADQAKEYDKKIDELTKRIETLTQLVTTNKTSVENTINGFDTKLSAATQKVSQLETKVDDNTKKYAAIEKRVQTLEARPI